MRTVARTGDNGLAKTDAIQFNDTG
jgi:hypothetical protein